MELFSEIYSCYYRIVDRILTEAERRPLTEGEMEQICRSLGFSESSLYLLPKLLGGEWQLLTADGSRNYRALTRGHGALPLTRLQRSWLKTLLTDDRFRLFFTDEELSLLRRCTEDAELLWQPGDIEYYDRYTDRDPYGSPGYREIFQTLLHAIPRRQYVNISYQSEKGNRVAHHYLPLKLEYSEKNDRFRLLAVPRKERRCARIVTLNLRGVRRAEPLPVCEEDDFDFEEIVRKSYYNEPLRLMIKNQRNALERTMLHFSNYEKKTKKIDEDTWECLIYYNHAMETELLIEVLSFGPAVKVTGPETFLRQIRERLQRQTALLSAAAPCGAPTASPSETSGSSPSSG